MMLSLAATSSSAELEVAQVVALLSRSPVGHLQEKCGGPGAARHRCEHPPLLTEHGEACGGRGCRLGSNTRTGVICLYRYFEIFLLVLISFPTAKSFLQRIFTPKNFLALGAKKLPANHTFFPKKSAKSNIFS